MALAFGLCKVISLQDYHYAYKHKYFMFGTLHQYCALLISRRVHLPLSALTTAVTSTAASKQRIAHCFAIIVTLAARTASKSSCVWYYTRIPIM